MAILLRRRQAQRDGESRSFSWKLGRRIHHEVTACWFIGKVMTSRMLGSSASR